MDLSGVFRVNSKKLRTKINDLVDFYNGGQ